MDPATRASLLLLAMLSSLAVVPVLIRRLHPATLVAVHGLGMTSAFGVALGARNVPGSGIALAVPYLMALALVGVDGGLEGRRRVSARAITAIAAFAGLAAAATAAAAPQFAIAANRGAAVVAIIALLALGGLHVTATATDAVAARRQRHRAVTVGVGLAVASAALSLLPFSVAHTWPTIAGAGAALVGSTRLPPQRPPTPREWGSVGLMAVAGGLCAMAAVRPAVGLLVAILVFAGALGILTISRTLLEGGRVLIRPRSAPDDDDRLSGMSPAPQAFSLMAPMLDDGALRRPNRPVVWTRISARRLLDAALSAARAAQGTPERRLLRVETVQERDEADIECDAGEVAEALMHVLDNALALRATHPDVNVRVHVRGGFRHVTFEISDDLKAVAEGEQDGAAEPNAPFRPGSATAGARLGLGVALARARVLVEKNGGTLVTLPSDRGSTVQLTLPRRREREKTALA